MPTSVPIHRVGINLWLPGEPFDKLRVCDVPRPPPVRAPSSPGGTEPK